MGFNAVVLTELKGLGYEGTYASVVKYIGPWLQEFRSDKGLTVRFEEGPAQPAVAGGLGVKVYLMMAIPGRATILAD